MPGLQVYSLDWGRTVECWQSWRRTGRSGQLQGYLRFGVVVAGQCLLGLHLHWLVWRCCCWWRCWSCCCCWWRWRCCCRGRRWWWRWSRTVNTGVGTTVKTAEAVIGTVWSYIVIVTMVLLLQAERSTPGQRFTCYWRIHTSHLFITMHKIPCQNIILI